ncbi:SufE family protein [Candidatus Liberibacter africanus]|uniref:Fe-S metabolism associated domain-containing protein n=1 Tax=Candidatus Liberibacter africanus PTSAPSY TaxID=1277257 RepID=A0A0G3I7S6_LIBAF|nr:SufE family protein [Candidatus Liberibacter africanus]AKK20583.1 hypothetical protein G293_04840 [Candidatus Liberibacter africanus PTSAPSY]QTP64277.1 SufE family protein [Candidatus Liberibacter africanus]
MIPINDIIENMNIIDDIEDRYHYLIELGKKLPPFPKEYMIDENIISACVSKLWMVTYLENKKKQDPIMVLYAFSDSQIVCGILYIIRSIYANKSISEILKIDSLEILQRIGLTEYLSQKRINGLHTVIHKIQYFIKEYSDSYLKK